MTISPADVDTDVPTGSSTREIAGRVTSLVVDALVGDGHHETRHRGNKVEAVFAGRHVEILIRVPMEPTPYSDKDR
jgi:hypothetical protein